LRIVRTLLIALALTFSTMISRAQNVDELQAIMDRAPAECSSNLVQYGYLDYGQCDSSTNERFGAKCADEVARKNRIIWKWNSFVRNCRAAENRNAGSPPTPAQGNNAAVTAPTGTTVEPDSEEVVALIQRARKLAEARDIAAARLVLRRAAEKHSAQAALALGGMYDPNVLKSLGVQGVEPDIAEARSWYEKASEYGSAEAMQRLHVLVDRGP
jgi:TPR repeat protein